MLFQNIALVFRLLVRGQTRLIKSALLALPLILIVVFFSIFSAQNLLASFERHMEKSYFGVFGELQVAAQPPFLARLYNEPLLNDLARSYRLTHKSVLLFEGKSRRVLKGVDVIAYDSRYLQSKFPQTSSFEHESLATGYQSGTLILSSVAYNQLGGRNNAIEAIYNPSNEQRVEFKNYYVVDFGFLGAQPIVVMSLDDLQALQNTQMQFNEIEYSDVSDADIKLITSLSEQLMLAQLTNSYRIINPKTLTSEARSVFETVRVFKNLLSGFLVLVSLSILWLALKLLLDSKRASLQIIECIGVSQIEIRLTVILVITITAIITLSLGQELAINMASYLKLLIGLPHV